MTVERLFRKQWSAPYNVSGLLCKAEQQNLKKINTKKLIKAQKIQHLASMKLQQEAQKST